MMTVICPFCGLPINKEDYEIFGGHRECLIEKEEEEND